MLSDAKRVVKLLIPTRSNFIRWPVCHLPRLWSQYTNSVIIEFGGCRRFRWSFYVNFTSCKFPSEGFQGCSSEYFTEYISRTPKAVSAALKAHFSALFVSARVLPGVPLIWNMIARGMASILRGFGCDCREKESPRVPSQWSCWLTSTYRCFFAARCGSSRHPPKLGFLR
jgi:hypothetical protein